MKKSTRVVALLAGVTLVAAGIFRLSVYMALVGAIILAAMLLSKKIAVTEEGVVVTYDVVLFQYREVWEWDKIQEIHKELSPDCTKYALHFMKEIMSRRLVYPIAEANQVIDFALEMNPEIHVGNVNK